MQVLVVGWDLGEAVGAAVGGLLFRNIVKFVLLTKKGMWLEVGGNANPIPWNMTIMPWNKPWNMKFIPWNIVERFTLCETYEEDEDRDFHYAELKSGLKFKILKSAIHFDDKDGENAVRNAIVTRSSKNFFQCVCDLDNEYIDSVEKAKNVLEVATRAFEILAQPDSEYGDLANVEGVPYAFLMFAAGLYSLSARIKDSCADVEIIRGQFNDWVSDHDTAAEDYVRKWIKRLEENGTNEWTKHQVALLANGLRLLRESADLDFLEFADYLLSYEAVTCHVDDEDKAMRGYWLPHNFMQDEHKEERRYIVCSDSPIRSEELFNEDNGRCAILRAEDIIAANKRIEEVNDPEYPGLKFDFGHPRNGCTYVQSPVDGSRYYEVNAYHCGLVNDKYEEFKELLKALGAFSYSMETSQRRDRMRSEEDSFDCRGGASIPTGKAGGEYHFESKSSSESSMFIRLKTHEELSPTSKPHVPDGLRFYKHDEKWKKLVRQVKEKNAKKIEVEFECKEALTVNVEELMKLNSQVSGKLYSFNLGLEESFKYEEKELKETGVKYSVSFVDDKGRWADEYLDSLKLVEELKKSMSWNERMFFEMVRNDLRNGVTDHSVLMGKAKDYEISLPRAREIIYAATTV